MALVLASSSAIRRQMLANAGVVFETLVPAVDEGQEKGRHKDPAALATALAAKKALSASARRPDDWTVGSDSVASVEGRLFDKPADRAQAAAHLRAFSGKILRLTSAVALANAGQVQWSDCDSAELRVRTLSEVFIDSYLDAEWPEVGYCVGVFRLEGRGVQLFDSIEGSYFTVLGMPLLPLLRELRRLGVIAA